MTRLLMDSPYTGDGCDATSQALVLHENAVVPVEARLEKLRKDREIHTYKQIWTKDPHEGPYRKAGVKLFDPLLQLPDGTQRQVELGYERVECGPTTNFVGNHMTQGAIDLVQAELERPTDDYLLQLLERCLPPEGGMQLLDSRPAEPCPAQQPVTVPLRDYSWWDAGDVVCVQLDVTQCREQLRLPAGSREPLQLSCNWGERSVQLQLLHHRGEEGVEGVPMGASLTVQLLLDPLCQAIQPARCSVEVAGPRALLCAQLGPPIDDSPAAARAEGNCAVCLGEGTQHPTSADGIGSSHEAEVAAACSLPLAQPSQPQAPSKPAANVDAVMVTGPGSDGTANITIRVGPATVAVVVRLRKADPGIEWGSLQGPLAVVAAPTRQQHPDLATLRKFVRQQRQAATGRRAASGGGQPCDSLPDVDMPTSDCQLFTSPAAAAGASPAASPAAGAVLAGEPAPSWVELLSSAQHSVRAGQHQAAIDACTALLQHWAPALYAGAGKAASAGSPQAGQAGLAGPGAVERPGELAEVLALRAECHCQVGSLKQAIADYTTALELYAVLAGATVVAAGESPVGSAEGLEAAAGASSASAAIVRLLLAKAAAHEQLEQYERALQDLREAAASPQPAVDPQVALSIQRVSRSLRESEKVQEKERSQGFVGSAQPPSVSRQSRYFIKPKGIRI